MSEPLVYSTIASIREGVASLRAERPDAPVVLVPTMGALHAGHLAHVRRGLELDAIVVVSIFVNPLQFGAGEDLERYPRTLDADVAALAEAGAHAVFAPSVAEMYPDGEPLVTVRAGEGAHRFEGASRPGHFDGMLTVVSKLLGIIMPDVATFGRKDAQQLHLVERMVHDLNNPVDIEPIPIVREPDGLALSSRNRYLSPQQRASALSLSRALRAARETAAFGVEKAMDAALSVIEASTVEEAVASENAVRLDYLDIVDPGTFRSVAPNHQGEALAVIAARVGTTRLIDNETLTVGPLSA